MKYMLLIYNHPESRWQGSEADWAGLRALVDLKHELIATGELISAEGLELPAEAKSVRVRKGVRAVTDGPFVETKEHLAGYFLVECDSETRAYEIAARMPPAHSHGIEVRRVVPESEMGG